MMTTNPIPRPLRVAAVVPVYNGEQFIAATLESILSQTRQPDEVIVVNDGSTDRSSDIARSYPVRVIDLERNVGLPAARNRGFLEANADVIALCDADDLWLESHLASTVGLLEAHAEAALAYSRVRLFGDLEYEQEARLPANTPVHVYWEQYHANLIIPSSSVIRKDVWQSCGQFDESLRRGCEDWEFFLRLTERHAIVCADDISVRYRKHALQITTASKLTCRLSEYDIRDRLLRHARSTGSPSTARMEAAMLSTWETRLGEAWDARSWFWMQTYLGLHRVVPGSKATYRRWRPQSFLIPVARVIDVTRAFVERVLVKARRAVPQRNTEHMRERVWLTPSDG